MAKAFTGVWQEAGGASPLTCTYLGAGLQEQTKVNTKLRFPVKEQRLKLGIPPKIKSTVRQNVLSGFSYNGEL